VAVHQHDRVLTLHHGLHRLAAVRHHLDVVSALLEQLDGDVLRGDVVLRDEHLPGRVLRERLESLLPS
jgi:hypothetical protein